MTDAPERREWLSPTEAADLLGVSERTLYTWRAEGILPAAKIGGVIRYRRSRIEERLTRAEAVA